MGAQLEVREENGKIYVTANGADMVVDGAHPLYAELKLVIEHVIRSAARHARESNAGSLTVDDLIAANRERLEQLEELQRQQQAGE